LIHRELQRSSNGRGAVPVTLELTSPGRSGDAGKISPVERAWSPRTRRFSAWRRGVHRPLLRGHDTLEDVWNGVRGPSRDFFQGLIQVSVGFHHLTRGNLAGAESLFRKALGRLEKYPDTYFGFDLGGHRAEIRGWLERVRAGDPLVPGELPRWELESCRAADRGPRSERP
jgi:hypothetical protein